MNRFSVRTKILVFVVLAIGLISVPLVWDNHIRTQKLLNDGFNGKSIIILETLGQSALFSLETGLIDQFEETARQLVEETVVTSIELKNASLTSVASIPKQPSYIGIPHTRDIIRLAGEGDLLDDNPFPEVTPEKIGTLTVFINDSQTLSERKKSIERTIMILVYILVVGTLCIYLANRHLMTPISVISKGVNEFKNGNYAHKIRLNFDNELSDLSELINYTGEVILETEKERERIFELKKSILQIAAHDLRTPIGHIKTLLDMAYYYCMNKKYDEIDSLLHSSFCDIDSLERHINSILSLSSLENDTLIQTPDWININEAMEKITQQFQSKIVAKKDFAWNLFSRCSASQLVKIDHDLFIIIVSNAIDNAIKYTQNGFVKVIYEVKENSICVTVHDTGIGFDKTLIPDSKKSAKQLQNHIRRTRDGWGIGLSAMYNFTEFLNGKIYIESKEKLGTIVNITIPVEVNFDRDENANIEKVEYLGAPNSAESKPEAKNSPILRVMAIDNDPDHLALLKRLLSDDIIRSVPVKLVTISDPSIALRHIEEQTFDLLLIDYHMPYIDGLQFLKHVNESDNMCSEATKIILTADKSIPGELRVQMRELCHGVVSKGLTVDDVRRIVRKVYVKSAT